MPVDQITEEPKLQEPVIDVESTPIDPSMVPDPAIVGEQIAITHIPNTEALIDRYGEIFKSVEVDSGNQWFIEQKDSKSEGGFGSERFLATKRFFPFPDSAFSAQKLGSLYALNSKDKDFNIWDLNITDSPDDKYKEAIKNGITRMKQTLGEDNKNLLSIDVVLPSGERIALSLISYTLTGAYIYDRLTSRHPNIQK